MHVCLLRSSREVRLACFAFALTAVLATPGFTRSACAQLAPALQHGAINLGQAPASTPVLATVWLQLQNKPALDAAVKAMYTPGSPTFRHFAGPDALQQFAPSAAQVASVRQELTAHHLQIVRSDANGFSMKIAGQASDFEAAFHTVISQYRMRDGSVVQSLSTAPALGNGAAGMVSAVTGVSGPTMQPFFKVPLDPATGKQVGITPASASPDGYIYSSNCIYSQQTVTLGTPGGAKPAAQYTGLVYGAAPTNNKFGTIGPCGYAPQDVYKFYGLNTAYNQGYTGKGQTIAIVDAYGSPTLQADITAFNKIYGLTPATTTNFQLIEPAPVTTSDSGWAEETTLDAEWTHAIAPDADIKLIVTPSNNDDDLQSGVLYVITNKLANVISNSYGQPEQGTDLQTVTSWDELCEMAALEGISVNFATGDVGDYASSEGLVDVSVPADSPYATAVGGTSATFSPVDGSVEQTGWGTNLTLLGTSVGPSDPPTQYGFQFGAGGGTSLDFKQPAFQAALHGAGRQIPDVSALADPYTGVECLFTLGGTQYFIVIGGTSLATPIFSGEWALLNQKMGSSLGQAAPYIAEYAGSGAITDIVPPSMQYAVQGAIQDGRGVTYYSADAITMPQTSSGFVSGLYSDGMGDLYALSFGTDSSLNVTQGWDPVTGYGTLDMGAIFSSFEPKS